MLLFLERKGSSKYRRKSVIFNRIFASQIERKSSKKGFVFILLDHIDRHS